MKRLILPLIALALLAGTCPAAPVKPTPQLSPESLGTRRTAWGVLPTYSVTGQRFTFARLPRPSLTAQARKPVTLDVLVNADGSVEDATITASSGNAVADLATLASFIGARYSLQPGDDYPAPFVVQLKMSFSQQPGTTYANAYGPFGRQDSMPPSGAPFNQAWSGAGGGWSGGGGYSNSSSSSSSSSGK